NSTSHCLALIFLASMKVLTSRLGELDIDDSCFCFYQNAFLAAASFAEHQAFSVGGDDTIINGRPFQK
ncbi:hypothetical protein, partial [Pseudomonas sp. SIMBA_068]|uniref:hypothetical protein n=1 Tax=Pseudomonas sp. SIMBA_068 TaxID=3085808 RepID=UPI00397952D8